MDRDDIRASLTDLDEAATRWDRAADICERRKDPEGASVFRANADTADRCRVYLEKYAGTSQEREVRREVRARIEACSLAERRELLRADALRHRGTMRGLVAAMRLAGWSKEDADKVYSEMRKDRRIQDQLKASRADAPSADGSVTDLRAARRARATRQVGRVPAGRTAAATDPDLASFLRGA